MSETNVTTVSLPSVGFGGASAKAGSTRETEQKQRPKNSAPREVSQPGTQRPPAHEEDAEALIAEVNDIMEGMRNDIRFTIARDSRELVVQVVNAETEEIIRTIPTENLRDMRTKFDEALGLIFDEER